MSRQDLSDFEIGYDYVRRRYSSLAEHSPETTSLSFWAMLYFSPSPAYEGNGMEAAI